MCRIAGIIDFNQSLGNELEPALIKIRDSMIHGGPDDAGVYISDDRKTSFAHRRLSIIDISSLGHQPMSDSDKNVWITYNGEIYNFCELKEELSSKGYKFRSKTDTEVLIYGYKEWGIEKLLSRLRGMFAFAIYDTGNKTIYLARDRFGIKPLYYYKDKNKFIFASEVKAMMISGLIPDETNKEATIRFLQLGSVPEPLTTVKNLFSVPAGHYMVLSGNELKTKQYWSVEKLFISPVDENRLYDNAVNATHDLLLESVKSHLISDVPLGVFLSGGIDSSSIVALASEVCESQLKTLSVVFDEKEYSEAKYAKLIAEKYKTNHHEVLIQGSDFINELPKILDSIDQPTIDGVNTYFVSKAAKEAGLTVVLSGIGGDELFLGYPYYRNANNLNTFLKVFHYMPSVFQKAAVGFVKNLNPGKLSKLDYLCDDKAESSYLLFRGLFTFDEIKKLLDIDEIELKDHPHVFNSLNGSAPISLVNFLDLYDFKHYLQNQILKDVDFMSMRHSIEVRVPFLDHTLVEYIIPLPEKIKLRDTTNKRLLVNSMRNGLPVEVTDRKKKGFTFPFDKWIRENLEYFQSKINNSRTFNSETVSKLLNDFRDGKVHWSRVWGLVVLNSYGDGNI